MGFLSRFLSWNIIAGQKKTANHFFFCSKLSRGDANGGKLECDFNGLDRLLSHGLM